MLEGVKQRSFALSVFCFVCVCSILFVVSRVRVNCSFSVSGNAPQLKVDDEEVVGLRWRGRSRSPEAVPSASHLIIASSSQKLYNRLPRL